MDIDATMRHLDQLIQAGVHGGRVVLGSIGENTLFSAWEKAQLLRATVETADGRIPILTGVAEFTTAQACRSAAEAADIGADGLMVLPAMVYQADHREPAAPLSRRRGGEPAVDHLL